MASQIGAILSVNAIIGKIFTQPKGSLAERLSSTITVCILAISSAILLSTHVLGEPITCWTPAQFTKTWVDFVNQYCYVHGTYFVPLEEGLDYSPLERRKFPINYYQWVPYILAAQALLYYLPRFIWRCFCSFSGYDLIEAIHQVENNWQDLKRNEEKFKARLATFEKQSAIFIWDGILLARKKRLHYLPFYYFLYIFLQACNSWVQFIWLNASIQSATYTLWGPSIISDLFHGVDWQVSGHFPRITHCDFSRRRPASVQLDTVLCVLTLNIYYEKLLLFLWFWMLIIAIVTTVSCISWAISFALTGSTKSYRFYTLKNFIFLITRLRARLKGRKNTTMVTYGYLVIPAAYPMTGRNTYL
ncbi:unnamed protein product [Dracunculus medinensis]|uniref:Innexin n=1 Tax=Dracunculus medinensis TaxID=318479 RepID=A0A0N4URQ9_DRAME|nr:unnamed protein product [Dracunculus medinensis]